MHARATPAVNIIFIQRPFLQLSANTDEKSAHTKTTTDHIASSEGLWQLFPKRNAKTNNNVLSK